MSINTNLKSIVKSGILGLCVADAIGVPVEFMSRDEILLHPVTDMIGYGTFNLPPGSWSDDTSLTLCLIDSLSNGLDYKDIMKKFLSWYCEAEYTPHGITFDIGRTCMKSILRFSKGTAPIKCGGTNVNDNGNGSLMRILPIAFYLHSTYGRNYCDYDEAYEIIHNISALTHAHIRSKIACGIYISIAGELINRQNIENGVYKGISFAKSHYNSKDSYSVELKYYNRLFDDGFNNIPMEEIKSSGYVVDTLEAALWCLLNTDNYRQCVLKAVNLGDDTDTVAAVAGGLAGLFYGLDSIPQEWINQIARIDYILDLCDSFI